MELSLFNTSNADSKVFQKYADFTIVCGKYIFQVHKAVVCSQSPYFEALCSSEFKEAIERRVELKEDHPEAVRCLVEYLYKGRYEVHCTESAENELFKVIGMYTSKNSIGPDLICCSGRASSRRKY